MVRNNVADCLPDHGDFLIYMSAQNQTQEAVKPNGAGLLALGLLSFLLGPFTAVPGLVFSKQFRPFTPTAAVGYFLCWLFLVCYVLVFLLFISISATSSR